MDLDLPLQLYEEPCDHSQVLESVLPGTTLAVTTKHIDYKGRVRGHWQLALNGEQMWVKAGKSWVLLASIPDECQAWVITPNDFLDNFQFTMEKLKQELALGRDLVRRYSLVTGQRDRLLADYRKTLSEANRYVLSPLPF